MSASSDTIGYSCCKGAADRERRRVRRALSGAVFVLRTAGHFDGLSADTSSKTAEAIDAATRSRRKRR